MAVVSLLYLVVVGSVIAFALYYWLVRNMDVTHTMLIALVTPVVAVILGMIVLHERLNWRLFAGAAYLAVATRDSQLRKRVEEIHNNDTAFFQQGMGYEAQQKASELIQQALDKFK